jgi:cyclophilin family peptidyl-prolyl cis-trans isomerase
MKRGAVLLYLALVAATASCQRQDGAGHGAESTNDQAGAAAPAAVAASHDSARAPAPTEFAHDLNPLPGQEASAPALARRTLVRFETTAGEITIAVYPDAAPNAAQRFLELVKSGFYDDTPISRVVPGFVAQFGVNWREPHKDWKDRNFDDDPSFFALERGTLAFAKAGPNTNSTQVFINYKENNQLADPRYNFTVFGKVLSGMDAVDQFAQVGDPSNGLDQDRLWDDGEAYLASLPAQPTMIEHAEVVE